MSDLALRTRIVELEAEVRYLRIMLEEARVLADAERAAADAMEHRMAIVIGGRMQWAAQA